MLLAEQIRASSHLRVCSKHRPPPLLTPPPPQQFAFTRPNGSVVHLDVASIVDYLLHTGDFRDPESRLPFDDASLARLDALAADMDLGKPSVVAAKRDARRYADAREMRDGLRGVEGMLSDVCSDMMQVVEHCDGESGEMQLLMAAFPAFTELYLSLLQGDAEVARQALEHCVSFLRGPPNRPTLDPNAFVRYTRSVHDMCLRLFCASLAARPCNPPAYTMMRDLSA